MEEAPTWCSAKALSTDCCEMENPEEAAVIAHPDSSALTTFSAKLAALQLSWRSFPFLLLLLLSRRSFPLLLLLLLSRRSILIPVDLAAAATADEAAALTASSDAALQLL